MENKSVYGHIEHAEMDSIPLDCLGVAETNFPDGSPSMAITLQFEFGREPVLYHELNLEAAERFQASVDKHVDKLRERTQQHGAV